MGPNNFPLPTGDQPSGQDAGFFVTQSRWGDVLLDDPNSSSYQFTNSLPHVSPQESEYASTVYPALPDPEQLSETVETSLQLGPGIQTFELHANDSERDQMREHSKRNPLRLIRLVYHHGSE